MKSKTQAKSLLIINYIEVYLDEINSNETYNYPFMIKLRAAITAYLTLDRFSRKEYEEVMKIADTQFMKDMVNVQVDRTIFALEMLYLYVKEIPKHKRADLNISDTKLLAAKGKLVRDMLKLKKHSDLDYNRVKEIVDNSRLAAKRYFDFIENYGVKDEAIKSH